MSAVDRDELLRTATLLGAGRFVPDPLVDSPDRTLWTDRCVAAALLLIHAVDKVVEHEQREDERRVVAFVSTFEDQAWHSFECREPTCLTNVEAQTRNSVVPTLVQCPVCKNVMNMVPT